MGPEFSFYTVRQQAVRTNSLEAVRKNVLTKAIEELAGRNGLGLDSVPIGPVAITIRHLASVAVQEPVIADRNAERVTAQVVHQLTRPGNALLQVVRAHRADCELQAPNTLKDP